MIGAALKAHISLQAGPLPEFTQLLETLFPNYERDCNNFALTHLTRVIYQKQSTTNLSLAFGRSGPLVPSLKVRGSRKSIIWYLKKQRKSIKRLKRIEALWKTLSLSRIEYSLCKQIWKLGPLDRPAIKDSHLSTNRFLRKN